MSRTSRRRAPPTFAQLLARHDARTTDDEVSVVSLSRCLTAREDPQHVLGYLAGLGQAVSSLDGLLAAVNNLDDEEELGATEVREGVAVSIASHGLWVLFVP